MRRNKAKAKPVPPHKSLTGKCRLCGKRHTRQAHRAHGLGAYIRTHHPQPSPVSAQSVYDALVKDSADKRIDAFLKYIQSGETKLTGRLAKSLEGKRATQLQQDIRWEFDYYTRRTEGDDILAFMDAHPREAIEAAGFSVPMRKNPAARCGDGVLMYGQLMRMVMRRPPDHKCNKACRAAHHVYFHDFTEPDWQVIGAPDKRSLTIRKGA